MAQLLKVHGSENRFFLMDQTRLARPLDDQELSRLARNVTDPRHGVLGGADGLLVVSRGSSQTLGRMRIFNADGSEALMCGNGLRAVARYLAEKHHRNRFQILVSGTKLTVSRQPDLFSHVPAFSVEISPVKFDRKALPFANLGCQKIIDRRLPQLDDQLRFTAVALPNPHLISFVTGAAGFKKLGPLGKRLNCRNPYFPDGVNVSFAKVLGANRLFVKTYERGVGFTNACGTGMSAASLAFLLTQPHTCGYGQAITVRNPGGMVKTIVHRRDNRHWINLIGNATFTDVINVSEKRLHAGDVDGNHVTSRSTGEERAYRKFVKSLE